MENEGLIQALQPEDALRSNVLQLVRTLLRGRGGLDDMREEYLLLLDLLLLLESEGGWCSIWMEEWKKM